MHTPQVVQVARMGLNSSAQEAGPLQSASPNDAFQKSAAPAGNVARDLTVDPCADALMDVDKAHLQGGVRPSQVRTQNRLLFDVNPEKSM
jgi:hypothetical protein